LHWSLDYLLGYKPNKENREKNQALRKTSIQSQELDYFRFLWINTKVQLFIAFQAQFH
jgi:hypothetical protein